MKTALLASTLLGLASAANPLIAGLGSSYAAGPGLAKPIGELLKAKLEAKQGISYDFSNIAVSGSVLGDIPKHQASKLDGKKPDLVYIVSGGNDLNYVGCLNNPEAKVCSHLITEDEFKKRYAAALDSVIKASDKDTKLPIYAVTYMTAVDTDSKCGHDNKDCDFDDAQLKEVKGIHDDVVDWTVHAINDWKKVGDNHEHQVKIIPMRFHSTGHHVGSQTPWINGHEVPSGAGGVAWHPNNAGAEAVADFIFSDFTSSG